MQTHRSVNWGISLIASGEFRKSAALFLIQITSHPCPVSRARLSANQPHLPRRSLAMWTGCASRPMRCCWFSYLGQGSEYG